MPRTDRRGKFEIKYRRQVFHGAVMLDDFFVGGNWPKVESGDYHLIAIGNLEEMSMSTATWRALSNFCFIAGFLSVIASIAIWFFFKSADSAHGERFGIFVGLWAPTFFALSSRLDRFATTNYPTN